MKSMTGFAHVTGEDKNCYISVRVKSLNSRVLNIGLHLPVEYQIFSEPVEQLLKKFCERGKVNLSVDRVSKSEDNTYEVVIQKNILDSWLKHAKKVSQRLGAPLRVDLQEWIFHPNVSKVMLKKQEITKEKKLLLSLTRKALQEVQNKRLQEGAQLKKQFEKIILDLGRKGQQIETLYKRLAQTRAEIGDVDSPKHWSIDEEIYRFKIHLKTLKKKMSQKGALGRVLEFYLQELHREAHTMGAKSQSTELTDLVICVKSLVDQFKEQVQNIE